ncbi:FAD binding domain-containing protein [Aspergillus pseudoustus]|uniref:FAD binding domain-containing protein n=1 Tax=Aspergillus pseudoustus TaxID=1810923 RepID=A0ABR4IPD5_9EURO
MPYYVSLPSRDERCFKTPPLGTPVLIVGMGPSGLLAAFLLAKRSIECAVIERHELRLGQPKAHAINPRSLEIFRQTGLDTTKLRELGSCADEAFWVRFNTGLTSVELGRIPYERQDEAVKDVTPEPLFNVSQPVLESFLQEAAVETGLVTLHRGWIWDSFTLNAQGHPVSRLVARDNPKDIIEITSEYLLGADGADSNVRRKIPSIDWEGLGGRSAQKNFYCSIHARGDIRQRVTDSNQTAQLYFCLHPDHASGLIVYDLSDSWVHTHAVDTNTDDVSAYTEEKCRQLIDECVGPGIDYTVESANLWYTCPRVSSSFHDESKRVFLVGDAAHSFPPQGGLGINTGIADVHNLIWKLSWARTLNREDQARFLETYTLERKPVATANATRSMVNEARWIEFNQFATDLVHRGEASGQGMGTFMAQDHVRKALSEQIAANKAHFDSLGMQLGYVYDEHNPVQEAEESWIYIPSARPGARLPHTWLRKTRSVLDLVPYGAFTLFHVGGSFEKTFHLLHGQKVDVIVIDIMGDGRLEEWARSLGLDQGGGLLVRPDQHVLAVVRSDGEVQAHLVQYFGRK